MDASKYYKVYALYNFDTDPRENFTYVPDVPVGFRKRLPRGRMYIVFPCEFKEENIVSAMDDIFSTYLAGRRYTFTYRMLHGVITAYMESPVDDSETFNKDSVVLELDGMPKHEVFLLAEVISKYTGTRWSSVIVIDPDDAGYYIGNFIRGEFDESGKRLNESSINRIVDWINRCDIACITAERKQFNPTTATERTLDDRPDELKGTDVVYNYTRQDSKNRNSHLKAELLRNGYGVTDVRGSWFEKGLFKDEDSFFVVNLNDDPDFFKKIFDLSELYNQDSFLEKERGRDYAVLVGTNNSMFPGYGERINIGKLHTNIKSDFFSRLGNRSFAFVTDVSPEHETENYGYKSKKQERIRRNLADALDTYENSTLNAKNIITRYSDEIRKKMKP